MLRTAGIAPLSVLLVQNATAIKLAFPRIEALRTATQATEPTPFELYEPLAALPVSFQTVSRPLELSLQSSLQLSLKVLVCYRSRGYISSLR